MAGDLTVVLSEGQSRYLSIRLKRASGWLSEDPSEYLSGCLNDRLETCTEVCLDGCMSGEPYGFP